MLVAPPVPLPSNSHSWTALLLVSPPLPPNVSVVQFDILNHDLGWCSNPNGAISSWFEVSILGSWSKNAVPELHPSYDDIGVMSRPEDFGQVFQQKGSYLKDMPLNTSGSGGRGSSTRSISVARNGIQWGWQHHTITWSRNVNNGKNDDFLSLLEEGDRLVIWARAQVLLRESTIHFG